MAGHREEDAYQAKFDAAVQDSIKDYLRPDTGFFSPTEDPEWLDFGYVGMDEDEAVAAAEHDGIGEIRVFRLPFRSAYRLDYKPERLNFAITEGRVLRAAFF